MHTEVIRPDKTESYNASIERAAHALRDGALVVFPTETVYGVAANAAHPEAMRRLRALKGRQGGRPFTVHIGEPREAQRYVPEAPALARRLARKAWPGPLTIICDATHPEQAECASVLGPDGLAEVYYEGSVGLRCPDHPAARRLLSEAGVPVVASSANAAGASPPTDVDAALEATNGVVEFAIDGGRTPLKGSSTIVAVQGEAWRLLRAGVLEERTVARMATRGVLMVCTGNSCRSPMAEYLFRQALAERLGTTIPELQRDGYYVASAGTFAPHGGPASSGARDELARRGLDASGHRSQPLTPELIRQADRVFAMTPGHLDVVLDIAPAAVGRVELLDKNTPVSDPIGGGPAAYRLCAEQIERAVAARVEEFVNEDRDW